MPQRASGTPYKLYKEHGTCLKGLQVALGARRDTTTTIIHHAPSTTHHPPPTVHHQPTATAHRPPPKTENRSQHHSHYNCHRPQVEGIIDDESVDTFLQKVHDIDLDIEPDPRLREMILQVSGDNPR